MPSRSPVVDIRIGSRLWRGPGLDAERVVRDAAAAALARAEAGPSALSVLLTDDEEMAALNLRWRGRDGPTNVLSFPAGPDGPLEDGRALLGDIALGYRILEREAADSGTALADHVSHMVVHGVLHLLGHDHGTGRDALRMERRETEILRGLGIPDPHLGPEAPCPAT